MDENEIEFNFWPSFADTMLGLVLVLLLVMFLFVAVKAVGTLDLRLIERKQLDVINSIGRAYHKTPEEQTPEVKEETKEQIRVFCISLAKSGGCEIRARNEAKLQRITFSDHILFKLNEYEINEQGRQVLSALTEALKNNGRLSTIREIQIQGHADTARKDGTPNMYNVNLAAQRAMAVYEYFMNTAGIDPSEHLMSATSFGEFNPVDRSRAKDAYDREKLKRDNLGDKQRMNRRIELLLFY